MAEKEKCRCPICDTVGSWKNVDKYRVTPKGMHICENCGFVFYPEKYMSEDEAKDYYKDDYRQPPSIGNAYTGQRKLHMHSHFLSDLMDRWQKDGKDDPVVCDIGAAYGMFLNWFRSYFPKGDYYGTEFAEAYRRNAWQEYQIKLTHDFDKSKKYDLIASFKVAEHQLDIDKRLREYVECLKDGGYIYISVPTWFHKMTNFGTDGFDLEYYYHPDHINVWTKGLFETLLKKVGLKIVKFDDWMYDETYLCVRDDSLMDESPVYENVNDIEQRLAAIKMAWDKYQARDFEGALNSFPNFFEGWSAYYEINRMKAHEAGQQKMPWDFIEEKFINPMIEHCPHSLSSLRLAVDLNMRYDRFAEAVEIIKTALGHRPNQSIFLMALSHCFRQLAMREIDGKKKHEYLIEARNVCRYIREIDMQMNTECTNWIYQDNAGLPVPN